MKYKLENIRLRKVAEGKQNAGTLFIQADAVNEEDLFDEAGLVTIFNERLVNAYAQYLLPAQPNGKDRFGRDAFAESLPKDANNPLPDNFKVITHAQFEQYVFPGGPKIALDSEGRPVINEKTHKPVMRAAIWVFTKKIVDNETGELGYAKNWDPISVGQRIEANMYSTPDVQTAAGVTIPQGEDPLLTNGASAPAAPTAPAATA